MTERPRLWLLSWTAALAGAFLVLGVLVAADWAPLVDLNRAIAEPIADLLARHDLVLHGLVGIELATGTIAAAVTAAVALGAFWLKGHPRAGVYVALVTLGTIVSVHLLKLLYSVTRPEWQADLLRADDGAFPSGHLAFATAIGGAFAVLVKMLVRKRPVRRICYSALTLVWLVLLADRLLLGRHWPSDLLGGALLGGAWVLGVLAVWSPQPRSHVKASDLPLVTVPGQKRDLAVVMNPIKVEDLDAFRKVVTQMAHEAGWSTPVWHYTTVEDSGTGQAHQAAVDGADLVLVCGGDGTVREVCAELAGTGIPVGIVPAGTGNLLGRNLDLPLYFRSAIDVALNGQDRAIDMVSISGDNLEETKFLVMAGMGFDAAIMDGVNEDLKKKIGWIAYVLSALKALMFPTMKLEISVDDGPFTKHRARTIVIGNVGTLQGGMTLLPDAAIDDGQIDVVLLFPQRFFSWIPLVLRVLSRREANAGESVVRFTGAKVVVRSAVDVPRQIDGDTIGPGKELVCENVHGRSLVRVPR